MRAAVMPLSLFESATNNALVMRFNRQRCRRGSVGVTGMLLLAASVLVFSQLMLAAKQGSKNAEARVIYSGQFKGHVEPCG